MGGATAGAPEASTGEAGYGGNVDYANNTGYVDAGYAGDAGMGGEGDANVPMPTMSDNMEGNLTIYITKIRIGHIPEYESCSFAKTQGHRLPQCDNRLY